MLVLPPLTSYLPLAQRTSLVFQLQFQDIPGSLHLIQLEWGVNTPEPIKWAKDGITKGLLCLRGHLDVVVMPRVTPPLTNFGVICSTSTKYKCVLNYILSHRNSNTLSLAVANLFLNFRQHPTVKFSGSISNPNDKQAKQECWEEKCFQHHKPYWIFSI